MLRPCQGLLGENMSWTVSWGDTVPAVLDRKSLRQETISESVASLCCLMKRKTIKNKVFSKPCRCETNTERWEALLGNSQLKGKLTGCFRDWCPGRCVISLLLLGEPSNPLGTRWKKGGGVCGCGGGLVSVWDKCCVSDGGQSVSGSHHLTGPKAAAQVHRLD